MLKYQIVWGDVPRRPSRRDSLRFFFGLARTSQAGYTDRVTVFVDHNAVSCNLTLGSQTRTHIDVHVRTLVVLDLHMYRHASLSLQTYMNLPSCLSRILKEFMCCVIMYVHVDVYT